MTGYFPIHFNFAYVAIFDEYAKLIRKELNKAFFSENKKLQSTEMDLRQKWNAKITYNYYKVTFYLSSGPAKMLNTVGQEFFGVMIFLRISRI